MDPKPPPLVPVALPLQAALDRSAPLRVLRERLLDSQARLAAVTGLLPPGLAGQVAAGPVDDAGWTLLVANASVAAKLRQLRPQLEEALQQAGWKASPIRIKVQPR